MWKEKGRGLHAHESGKGRGLHISKIHEDAPLSPKLLGHAMQAGDSIQFAELFEAGRLLQMTVIGYLRHNQYANGLMPVLAPGELLCTEVLLLCTALCTAFMYCFMYWSAAAYALVLLQSFHMF
jgi:hypothetical protein